MNFPHPLKLISMISVGGLFLVQVLWTYQWDTPLKWYWMMLLGAPLLVPIKGLLQDKRYTYKWVGFLTFLYFCIGVSESFANDSHRFFSVATVIFSVTLYLSSIYYSRFLLLRSASKLHE